MEMKLRKITVRLVVALALAISSEAYAQLFDYDGMCYQLTTETTVGVLGDRDALGDVVIPEKVSYEGKEYTVTSIGEFSFAFSKIRSVVIPASVTEISPYAFSAIQDGEGPHRYSNPELTSIEVAADNPVFASKNGALFNKHFTTLILAPKKVKKFIVPPTVDTIDSFAFYDCVSLQHIEMPSSVVSIGSEAFRNCSSLISIELPSLLREIEYCAFANCTALTSIKIPDSIKIISGSCFAYCTSLKSVTIPSSVKLIEAYAFYGCESLRLVKIPSSVKVIEDRAFDSTVKLVREDVY